MEDSEKILRSSQGQVSLGGGSGMEIKNDKNYYKPKLKRIMYTPFPDTHSKTTVQNSTEKDQIIMIDAFMEKVTCVKDLEKL